MALLDGEGLVESAGNEIHLHPQSDIEGLFATPVVACLQGAYVGHIGVEFIGLHGIAPSLVVMQHPVAVIGKAEVAQAEIEGAFDVGLHFARGVSATGGVAVKIDESVHAAVLHP